MDYEKSEEEKRKEKEKKERIEASLRERNKEVKEQLSKYQNEREKERDQLRHDEAVECFKALLIDLIKTNVAVQSSSEDKDKEREKDKEKDKDKDGKDHHKDHKDHKEHRESKELSWRDAKKILKRDSRWSHCKILEKDKKEKLFEEHMNKFKAKKRDLFYQLLDETDGIKLKQTTWKEAKKLIKSDPRYEKLQQSDSFRMEKEYDSYINEKFSKAKSDFKELLLQTKLITYKSFATIQEQPQSNHLKEIEDILSKDKSFIVLECDPDERKKLLMEYIEQLHKEGPPPPPTATEPARRK